MANERELKKFTWGQLATALCQIGERAGVGTADGIEMLLRGELVIQKRLLAPAGESIVLPAQDGEFRVGELFAKGKHEDGVNIFDTNSTFRDKFHGKTETNVSETRITPYKLTEPSGDLAIITALGGEDHAEVSLRHLRELMRRTQVGEPTVIQPGVNVFYVRDVDRLFWALVVYWYPGRRVWRVGARSVGRPDLWSRGKRVFSCLPAESAA